MKAQRTTRMVWAAAIGAVWLAACAHTGGKTDTTPAPKPEPEATADAGSAVAEAAKRIPGEEVLAQKPAVPELGHFEAPVPTVRTLSNGLRVYIVERPESAIQAVRLVIRRGASAEPANLPGLASVTAELLESGSAGRSQAEIAAAVDAIGASLVVGASQDRTVVAMSALKTQLPQMVKLLSDVALRPNLAEEDFKKVKAQREAELLAQQARPEVAAELAFRASIYGQHPLARPLSGTLESVKAMELSQVKAFFQAFSPEQAALISVGGSTGDEAVAALEGAFGKWKATGRVKPTSSTGQVPAAKQQLVVVDFPEKPQSVLRIGLPAVPRSSPDYLALEVLNTILGGSFTSRLNLNLREKNGYSYGAFSGFGYGEGPGPFQVNTNVKTEVTAAALREALKEITTILGEPLSEEDLEKGKALQAADLVRMLETSDSAASAISEIFLYELPLDEYRTWVARLKALSSEQVQSAARRVLEPGKLTVTIAGDLEKVLAQLKAEPALESLPEPQRRTATGALAK